MCDCQTLASAAVLCPFIHPSGMCSHFSLYDSKMNVSTELDKTSNLRMTLQISQTLHTHSD